MDAVSMVPTFDKNRKLVLDLNSYWEENGIRFFKKPVRVNYIDLGIATSDCASIMKYFGDSNIIYVFAYPINKQFEKELKKVFYCNQLEEKGYDIFPGFEGLEFIL